MNWRDLLAEKAPLVVAPWLGGRKLCLGMRTWAIEGPLPPEHGWATFRISGRGVCYNGPAERGPAPANVLDGLRSGFLVGDRLVADDANVDPDPKKIVAQSVPVFLLEPGLDRFARIQAARFFEDGPFVFMAQNYPLGPEPEVQHALEDGLRTLDGIKGIVPALDAAFRMELYQRDEAERRRQEAERRRREEEARRAQEERRAELVRQLGDGAGRRAMAQYDFTAAARAALAVGDAQYLDHRHAVRRNEMIVRFRLDRRRFECTCDPLTLQIIDAGICLVDHHSDERGDTYFTLESLPGVIRQAEREGKLVVFRHVG